MIRTELPTAPETDPSSAQLGLREPSSFRDPAGFVFWHQGQPYRQVNEAGLADYQALRSTGLYEELVARQMLLAHEEVPPGLASQLVGNLPENEQPACQTLAPRKLSFVSYPYEWCFSQLRDSALLTLDVQSLALARGMTLKDASAFNVQLVDGRPQLIDTLSLERYQEGRPWHAYGQFCRHFLAPLALAAYCDERLLGLSQKFLDGVPLDLASRLLPRRTWLRFGLAGHLHWHARMESKHGQSASTNATAGGRMSLRTQQLFIESLRNTVEKLSWRPGATLWSRYYQQEHNYSETAFDSKKQIISSWIAAQRPQTVWDLGANNGRFSRAAAEQGALTVCWDSDAASVDANYRQMRAERETLLVPLVIDLTNPSPSLGWNHRERQSLAQRGPSDLALALGLVHHLAIGNNLPWPHLVEWFASIARQLVVEFVPKRDSQVQRMLASRTDIFTEYDETSFQAAFAQRFDLLDRQPVTGSERTLYLWRAKS